MNSTKTLFHASDVNYEEMIILNKHVLFTPLRIDFSSIPHGLLVYELRHSDEDSFKIAQIKADRVIVNFYGTILSHHAFQLKDGYKDIDEAVDVLYLNKDMSIEQYQNSMQKKVASR